jgi:hypothetical protein
MVAVGLAYAFLRCESASRPAGTRSTKTHVAHRRIKIERVYRPYLTALEAELWIPNVRRFRFLSNLE